jgi:phosphoribosylformylglycinamidine synthase subunit PurQ / glutaminase
MVQVGLLPGPGVSADAAASSADWPADRPPQQTVALAHNAGGSFIDQWVRVEFPSNSPCLWTAGIAERFSADRRDDVMQLPIAHGEGRFVPASPALLDAIERSGLVAVRYVDNVNGSTNAIAGICDPTGRIFALMPHPERYLTWLHHPYWTRLPSSLRGAGSGGSGGSGGAPETPGLMMFRNAVEAVMPIRAN